MYSFKQYLIILALVAFAFVIGALLSGCEPEDEPVVETVPPVPQPYFGIQGGNKDKVFYAINQYIAEGCQLIDVGFTGAEAGVYRWWAVFYDPSVGDD